MAFPAAVVFAAVFERFVDAPLQAWIKPRASLAGVKSMFQANPTMWARRKVA